METPAAHRALSCTRRPANATLTPDEQAWQQFIHHPDTLTWIGRMARAVYGHLSQHRADTLLATAWIALAKCDDYELARGSPIAFARTVIRRAWATAARARYAAGSRLERLDDVLANRAHDHAWLCDDADDERRQQHQNQADVRDALPLLRGDAKRWAETFLAVLRDNDAPITVVAHHRANPVLQTQQRLGWSRHAAEQVRAQVARDCHLRRLAPLRAAS